MFDVAVAAVDFVDLGGIRVEADHTEALFGEGEGDVAGITAKMMAEAPTAWNLYIGTTDADALSAAVTAAGEKLSAGAKVVVVNVVSGTTLEVEPLVEPSETAV